jgi:AcrR family transcriptional regulator
VTDAGQVKPRPGGRTARVRTAVLDATLATLLEHGYDAVTVSDVARAAGVHPTTIYRRWGGRPQLVAEVVHRMSGQAIPPPDEGSLAADLRVLLREVVDLLRRPEGLAVVRSLAILPAQLEDELAATRRRFWQARFDAAAAIVNRAVARGELPAGVDPHQVLEFLVAPAYLRALLTGAPLDEAFIDTTAGRVASSFGEGALDR